MNRTQKQQLIDELHADLEQASHGVVLDYRGLSVPAATEFRRKIKASGARYRVVKNSLALRAAKGTAFEKLAEHFDEMTGVAYTAADPVALAKTIVDFAKDEPAIQTRAGIVEREQVLDPAGIKALSEMPSLPELRSSLLGLMLQPATTLVRLLSTPATQMARALSEREKQLAGGQEA